MASYQLQKFYASPQTAQPKYFEDDDAILDDHILEDPMASRRPSIFSPKTEEWQQPDSHNPFVEQSNNPFMRLDPVQAATYGHQSWAVSHQYDGLPADMDQSLAFRPGQTPFSNASNSVSMFAVNSQTSTHEKEWMVDVDSAVPKRLRNSSPVRSHSPLLRRDGIRKKNARFDIPAERNLTNIDQLISQSTDEQEIKELKQQKRLLRNRQAALDSRQRKKQHTERLEDEKKSYTALISDLEEELANTKIALDECSRKEQQYNQYIDRLRLEKEELVRNHTIETGDLRKKVGVLSDHIQKLESTGMSTVPSSTGFADYSDIDTLNMESWDSVFYLEDKDDGALVRKVDPLPDKDKPAGLLLMILLFGAFVASRGVSGVSPRIPKMSDDVRAASATLLDDIFKDAGVPETEALATLPSWTVPAAPPGPSMLGDLTDSLSQPTVDQQNEQLFSLSAAQYDGVTSQDFLRTPQPSTSQGRRNLSEMLAAMRANSKQSAAEVYTRSLLWEQVPKDVVRDFARLVSECTNDDPPRSTL